MNRSMACACAAAVLVVVVLEVVAGGLLCDKAAAIRQGEQNGGRNGIRPSRT